MRYTYEIKKDSGICIVRIIDTFKRPEDAWEMQKLAYKLSEDLGCSSFLFDMRDVNIVTSTLLTYDTVVLNAEKLPVLRRVKVAVLYQEVAEDERFFENVAVNRGFSLRVFDNLDNSLGWLEEKNGIANS